MRKFYIKDIVSMKENEDVLFMVVDYMDFTESISNGKNIIDIDYELMQIYPVQKDSKYATVSQNDLMIKEKRGSRNYELLLGFINKDREKNGFYGTPDFIQVSDRNIKTIANAEKTRAKAPTRKLDTIRYDVIDTVDGCLDAINHLNTLYEMFGDEAYIQLKELVTARIIKLQE